MTVSGAMQALYEGDADRARTLLPPDDELSVFEAAAFGRADRLRSILAEKPEAAQALSDDGFTALHLAVFGKQTSAALVLIDHGADVDALATGAIARVRPLGTATFVRSVPMVRLLLEAGADVNGAGEGGFTALHSAAQNGDEELVRLLLEHGADPRLGAVQGARPADLAEDERLKALLGGE